MPETSLTPKGEATRQRILDAAVAEFAAYGLAGGRVDRIADAAHTNKAQLYAYFGSKEGLFDAVFHGGLDHITDVVPISGDDLADWAVRLYDEYLVRPDLIRLATWTRLERSPEGPLAEHAGPLSERKLAAIARAQEAGLVRSGEPFDLMAMVIAMSMTWSPVSNVYAATAAEPSRVHDARRRLLRQMVTAAVGGPAVGGPAVGGPATGGPATGHGVGPTAEG